MSNMVRRACHPGRHGHVDVLLDRRRMALKELSETVGATVVNLSVLNNDRAKAVRFSTLAALYAALDCQSGESFGYVPGAAANEQDETADE